VEIVHRLERAEPVDEAQCNRGKAQWRAQHRWRTAPPDIYASVDGHIDDAAVDRLIRIIGQDPSAPVFLTIRSGGGDPQSAMRAYDACRGHPARITCEVSSRCSSAALLVLVAGDVRMASRDARFTLHTCSFEIPRLGRHSAALLRDNAEALDVIDQDMAAIIGLRTRYPHWKLRADMAAETTLDAHAAWRFGVLTECPS
jgi:ATP-dependent protease ClpP protease subunit